MQELLHEREGREGARGGEKESVERFAGEGEEKGGVRGGWLPSTAEVLMVKGQLSGPLCST